MTKFVVQLLLSLMVGLGAAIGFGPDAKENLTGAWSETNASIHAAVESIFESDAQAEEEASVESSAEAGASTSLDLGAVFDNVTHVFSGFELQSSFSAEAETGTSAESNAVNVDLTNELESALGLGIGAGE